MKTFELRSDDRTRNPHQRVGSWLSQLSRSWRGRWGELTSRSSTLVKRCVFSQIVMSVNKNGCLGKPRQTTMRGREKWRRCGRSLRSTTRSQGDLREIWMSICGFAIACLQDNEHQKIVLTSLAFRYLFDLYYRRKAISRELYDYCVKVGHQFKS